MGKTSATSLALGLALYGSKNVWISFGGRNEGGREGARRGMSRVGFENEGWREEEAAASQALGLPFWTCIITSL
jgi:hypothetical protein